MSEAQDIQARHAHYLEQFKNGLDKDFLPFFKRIIDGLRAELLKTDKVRSQKRIQQKLDFVNSLVFDAMTEYVEQTQQQLMLFADSEAEFTAGTINRLLDEGATVPTSNQVWSAVKSRPFNNTNVQTVFKNYSRDMSRLVSDAVSLGFFEGKKTSDIVRDITGTVSANYKDGTLNQVRTAASRMVRTTSAHISAVANNRTYEQNIDLVPHYEWLSVLDARTSAICQERSGEVYETGKGPLPPAHPNCRSTISPLFEEDVNSKGEKTIKDDVPSYQEWLSKQSAKFQDEVLGPTKGKLFRQGGLTLDKFVNRAGQTLTLDQLKSKYPTVWDESIGD